MSLLHHLPIHLLSLCFGTLVLLMVTGRKFTYLFHTRPKHLGINVGFPRVLKKCIVLKIIGYQFIAPPAKECKKTKRIPSRILKEQRMNKILGALSDQQAASHPDGVEVYENDSFKYESIDLGLSIDT